MSHSGIVKDGIGTDTSSAHQAPEATAYESLLIAGYKEMSRINQSLAEEAVHTDNEALSICEEFYGV